jgi:SH3-like domain-containing protein
MLVAILPNDLDKSSPARCRSRREIPPMMFRNCVAAAAAMLMLSSVRAAMSEPLAPGAASGLPVPRFVSLKSDRVNVRGGPDKDHEVVWVYTKAALPVEITAEFENWRRVRDWDGGEGWVYHSLLSGRRTVMVAPKAKPNEDIVPLRDRPDPAGGLIARVQAGVLGTVKRCTGDWCRIFGAAFDGWIQQDRLWGVYPHEKID